MINAIKKVIVEASPEIIWEIITNNQKFSWRSDISKIEEVDATHFIEYTKNGFPTYFHIVEKIPFSLYHFSLKNDNLEANWVGILKKCDQGTEMTLEEKIVVSSFPMKLLAPFYLKMQQKKYIRDLQREIEIVKRQQRNNVDSKI